MRKPYYKKSHDAWYFNDENGKPKRLGKTEKEAYEAWRKMSPDEAPAPEPPKAEPVAAGKSQSSLTVGGLIDIYLEWSAHENNRTKATHLAYTRALSPLKQKFGDKQVTELLQLDLHKIVQERTDSKFVAKLAKQTGKPLRVWSKTTCWQLYKVTSAMLNWAADQRLIRENPLGKIKEKPRCGVRQDAITQEEFDRLIAACDDPLLTELLTVFWDTGARPFEIFQAEAKHLDRKTRCLRFSKVQKDKVKAKRSNETATRTVYLSQRCFEICRRLAEQRPTGKLFLNNVCAPWTWERLQAVALQFFRTSSCSDCCDRP